MGKTSFGALSGGIGAELTGGNFWRGAGQGATVALLNHYGKQLQQRLERPSKVNMKKNPVRGLKRWMRYINRYNGVDPTTRRPFNLSDIVNASTVPKKHWFMQMFGMLNDISGLSKVNGEYVKWAIADREISPDRSNDIYHISGTKVLGQNNVPSYWKIQAFNKQNSVRFNLIFYKNEVYKEYHDFIFGF